VALGIMLDCIETVLFAVPCKSRQRFALVLALVLLDRAGGRVSCNPRAVLRQPVVRKESMTRKNNLVVLLRSGAWPCTADAR
jgi:hypothetical protein